jgi:hypothetical protein
MVDDDDFLEERFMVACPLDFFPSKFRGETPSVCARWSHRVSAPRLRFSSVVSVPWNRRPHTYLVTTAPSMCVWWSVKGRLDNRRP